MHNTSNLLVQFSEHGLARHLEYSQNFVVFTGGGWFQYENLQTPGQKRGWWLASIFKKVHLFQKIVKVVSEQF